MSQVALISQTMRAPHCHAFFRTVPDGVILTSDPTAFAQYEFDLPTRIVAVSPPPELLPTARLTRGRVFRSVLNRARAGSAFGRWLERTIKRFVWRLRYLDRLVLVFRRKTVPELSERSITTSSLFLQLVEENQLQPIDRIVVFDVFDLPVALAFAQEEPVEVIVR